MALASLTACTVTAPVKESKSVVQEATIPVQRPKSVVVVTPARLRALARMQRRLDDVAAPLLRKNTLACKRNVRNLLGFSAQNQYSYSGDWFEMAGTTLGLGQALQIIHVMPRSGAASVGLRRGDRLLEIAGKPLPQGRDAEYRASALLAPHVLGQSKLPISIQRDGKQIKYKLALTPACGFGVELGNADEANLLVDGRRIMVTRGMMKLARTDSELAAVIAKGMAHNILLHPQELKMTEAVRGLMNDLRVGASEDAYSDAPRLASMPGEMDGLADRLSLYLLARVGYDFHAAPSFWNRVANSSAAKSFTALHPATDARIAAMEKTLRDIKLARLYRKR